VKADKINKFLEYGHKMINDKDPFFAQEAFKLGNCYVQICEYIEAIKYFEMSIVASFVKPMLWKLSAQPNLLVDIWILSGKRVPQKSVQRELNEYRETQYGRSLVAYFSYGLMELLYPTGADFSIWINELLKSPKNKDIFAIGNVFEAILSKNQSLLNSALINLLKAHEGMAKYGGLRETAEGLLCMPAMSLSYAACKRNMTIDIENDYLSLGYLEFLLNQE